ncbi:MAG: cupin domain-containing protein [Chloroflexota bacterium]
MTPPRPGSRAAIGTEDNPLADPVTGERIVFRKRGRDTGGELLEVTLYSAPTGFVPSAHLHPNQEERLEISGAPMTVRIGDQERIYEPGEVAIVPPGVPHVVFNATDQHITALMQFRPALDTETMFETYFGLAGDGKVGKGGLRNTLHLLVLARTYRREMQVPPPGQRLVGPLSTLVAPIAGAFGYRARYDRYSGPSSKRG